MLEKAVSVAKRLLQKNKLSLEEIAETAELPLEQVRQIARQLNAAAAQ